MVPANFASLGATGLKDALLTIPPDRRSSETWNQLAEFAHSLNNHALALSFVERALMEPVDPVVRIPRQLLRIELLLLTNQRDQAEALAKQFTTTELSDEQTVALACLFARFDMHNVADGMFERVRQQDQLTGAALAELRQQQAESLPKGYRRWELLLEAASSVRANNPTRSSLLERILLEADETADASVLGELAASIKNESIRTRLRMHQADLLEDRKQAAEIALDLIENGRIPAEQCFWALRILEEADRSNDIVRLVEARLRKGQSQEVEVKLVLREAYSRLGRDLDAQRAATDLLNQASPSPIAPPRRMNPQGGGGLFNVR
jgi:hypothetical protein